MRTLCCRLIYPVHSYESPVWRNCARSLWSDCVWDEIGQIPIQKMLWTWKYRVHARFTVLHFVYDKKELHTNLFEIFCIMADT